MRSGFQVIEKFDHALLCIFPETHLLYHISEQVLLSYAVPAVDLWLGCKWVWKEVA